MTADDASVLVSSWFERRGLRGGKLNAEGWAAASVGTTPVYFEWNAKAKTVHCRALIYRFEKAASAKVLKTLRSHDDGDAMRLDYLAPSRALCLKRDYAKSVSPKQFDAQVEQLVAGALKWATDGIEQALRTTRR